MDKTSLLSSIGLPGEFGVALLLLALVLLLAPYFAGHDFGVVKIPAFSDIAQRRLRVLGPLAMLVALALHIPMIKPEGKPPDVQKSLDGTPKSSSMLIESDGAKATAKEGDARISNDNRADILIFARESETGAGIGSLTSRGHTGDANSVIPLPPGWGLATKLVPPGGCTLQPTHVYNDGTGGYSLSVMTVARKGPCPWLKGEYRFQLQIHVGQYRGASMGKIVID
jgi:hypothetical protein